jgi:carboxypeptidase Q
MKKLFVVLALTIAVLAQSAEEEERVDLSVLNRIKYEAFQDGKVMDTLFYLTDVNGPRLTGSPGFKSAADWTVQQLKKWGIENARLESWGTFGRSWSLRRFDAHIVQPFYSPISGYPNAWSEGITGKLKADIAYAPVFQWWEDDQRRDPSKFIQHAKDYSLKYKGKLHGKIVMTAPLRDLPRAEAAPSTRYDEKGLSTLSEAPEPFALVPFEWPITHLPEDPKVRDRFYKGLPLEVRADFWRQQQIAENTLIQFLREEGVAAVFTTSSRGIGATWYAQEAGSEKSEDPASPPSISLQREQYDRIARLIERNIPVTAEVEMEVDYPEGDVDGSNVVAEIPGEKKKDEIVMLGGHLDSWHSGTGATDNAAGCAVALEAMRILKTLNLKMDRTIRMALWSGEEQGLYGSRAYVSKHFADPMTMQLKPEHAKVSGYFNLDNGSGKIRGVYLQGNDMMRPVFEKWFEPFIDLKANTLTIQDTGGTDHLSFDAIGIPGFQFIQDELDYETLTHHSNIDVYDHAEPGDMMQASAIMAMFVYNTAMREEMLPRKPLPKALPPRKK